MVPGFNRRHSQWYELILYNRVLHFLVGYAFVVLLPNWIRWGDLLQIWSHDEASRLPTFIANSAAYCGGFIILHKFRRFPGTNSLPFVIPTIGTAWLSVVAILVFLREESYARQVLLYSFLLANAWAFAGYFLRRRFRQPKLAVVPFGRAMELANIPHAVTTVLTEPDLANRRYDGVVADLHSKTLPDDWARFLAECTLARIPVFHTQQIYESITGRVKIEHLSENIFGALLPSGLYGACKRVIDVICVLILSPIWISLILLTGLAIKLESKGPMLFIQERVGQRNRTFRIYKLRSMHENADQRGAQFAEQDDSRITRVGHVIRRLRIDEIPQFINVLKGDMSLIGPRPEQRAFVDEFEKVIPFYPYRHVVKPGITGWAQVMQGYAADADQTKEKIEHDFYYIKHFSLWLDVLITFKTIRTVLTRFGAR